MQEIIKNVYIEDQFPGVTLGVIVTPRGLIQIDAPPSPEDARSWRAALMNLGDPGDLSLGQYAAIARGWNKAHGQGQMDPPSEAEFDAAVLRARGVDGDRG